jgi:acetyl esterase/lipase
MTTTTLHLERDISFAKTASGDLLCDIYHPPAAVNKHTAVIHLYGGGFRGGSKERMHTNATLYAERGYLGVAPNYRLLPDNLWPAQLHDVKAAIRWTCANAERLGIDAMKITLAGHSAGAILALIAAGSGGQPELEGHLGPLGVSSAVAACVAYYPPALMRWRDDGVPNPVMPPDATNEDYANASPLTYMKAGCPPVLLLHGTSDNLIPFDHSRRLFDALRAAAVPAELYLLDGVDHEFDQNEELAAISAKWHRYF